MKSCHIGLVFWLKCVSHVILKSLSDLIFGSQIAQFYFLSFVDNIMFLEDWIKVAWSCSHYFDPGWLTGPTHPWQLWECALLNDTLVNSKFAYLFSLCVSLNAYPVQEVVHYAFGAIKMSKMGLLTPGSGFCRKGAIMRIWPLYKEVNEWNWSQIRTVVGMLRRLPEAAVSDV